MLRDQDNEGKENNRLLHAPQDDDSGTEEASVFGTFRNSQEGSLLSGSMPDASGSGSSADPAFLMRHDLDDELSDPATPTDDAQTDDDEIRGPLFLSFKASAPADEVSEALREQNKAASIYQPEPIDDPEMSFGQDDVFSQEDEYMDAFPQDDFSGPAFNPAAPVQPEPKEPPKPSIMDTMYAKEDYRSTMPKYEVDSSLEDEINASLADENFSPFSPFAAFKPAAPVQDEPEKEEPASVQPVVDAPAAEEPASVQPVVDAPTAEEPVAEEPVAEEPVVEKPVVEEPLVEESVVEESPAETPVMAAPITEEPAAVEQVSEVKEESLVNEPVFEQPKPITPIMSIPVEMPTVSKPEQTISEEAASAVDTAADAATETFAEAVEEAVAEPVAETVAEAVEAAAAEPVTETVAEAVEAAAVEPVAETVTEAVEEAVAEPVTETVAETVETATVEPVAETVTEAVESATTEPVAETIAEAVEEAAATEPAAEAEPTKEETTQEQPKVSYQDAIWMPNQPIKPIPAEEHVPTTPVQDSDLASVSSYAGQPDAEDESAFATTRSEAEEPLTPASLASQATAAGVEEHEPAVDAESPSDLDTTSLYDTAPIEDPSMADDDMPEDFESIYRESDAKMEEPVSYSSPAIHPHVSIASSNLEPIDSVYNTTTPKEPESQTPSGDAPNKNHLLFGDEDEQTFHDAAMREMAERKKAEAEATAAAAAAAAAQAETKAVSDASNLRPGSSYGGSRPATNAAPAKEESAERSVSRPGGAVSRPAAVQGMSTSAQIVKAQHHRYTAAAQRGSITPVEQQERASEKKKSIVKPIVFICLGLICLGGLVFCWKYFDLGKALSSGTTTAARQTTYQPKTTSVIDISSDSETEPTTESASESATTEKEDPTTETTEPTETTTEEPTTTTTEAPTTTTEAPTTTTESPTTTTEAPTTTTEKPTTTTEKPTSKEPTETTSTPAPSEFPVTSFNTKIVNATGSSNACSFDIKFTNNGSKTSSVNASIEYVTFTLVSDTTVTDISCTNFTIEKKEGTSNTYYLYPNSNDAIAKGESIYATIEASGNSSFGSYRVKNLYVEYKK